MTIIKPHHQCLEDRHVFIPVYWERDIKNQTEFVTGFACQHCMSYLSAEDWKKHLFNSHASINNELELAFEAEQQKIAAQQQEEEKKAAELKFMEDQKKQMEEIYKKAAQDIKESNETVVRKRGRPPVKK